MKIRKARIEDTNDIVDILAQLSPPSEKEVKAGKKQVMEVMQRILQDENYLLCVAEEDGKTVGTGLLLIQMNLSHGGMPSGHIENIVVDNKSRGKGIGKEIIQFLMKEAKKKGCYKVILDCKKENVGFYENCGMHCTGEVQMRL